MENPYYINEITRLSGKGSDSKRRSRLISELQKGFCLSIEGKEVAVLAELPKDILRSYEVSVSAPQDDLICYACCHVSYLHNKGYDLSKYYDTIENFYRKKGLITLCTGLLAQVMIHVGMRTLYGEVSANNYESIRARFVMPDYIHGGWFTHGLYYEPETEDTATLVTYLDWGPRSTLQNYQKMLR